MIKKKNLAQKKYEEEGITYMTILCCKNVFEEAGSELEIILLRDQDLEEGFLI